MLKYAEIIEDYITNYGLNIIPTDIKKRAVIEWGKYQTQRLPFQELSVIMREIARKDAGKKEFEKEARVQGFAVITGEISNLTVLDFDLDHISPEWFKTFSELNIPIAKTGSGGRHFYFRYSDKLQTLASQKTRIDIRNNGGYAVIPPSQSDKGSYEWVKDLSNKLIELPNEFVVWYKHHNNQDTSKSFLVDKKATTFEGVSEGGRNHKATQVAGSLINAFRSDLNLAWNSLKTWNLENNPPLEEKELETVFNSIAKIDARNNPVIKVKDIDEEVDTSTLLDFTMREELPLGIPDIDNKFRFPSGFYLIPGTPGTGKGFFALWLTRIFWERYQKKSIYYSLEMSEELVRQRYLQTWSDLTLEQFKEVVEKKDYSRIAKAVSYVKEKVIIVDEFGVDNLKLQTPENFKISFENYYQKGYRIFHFDHFHQLSGSNVNDKNQEVAEKWGLMFQSLSKQYSDTWLFIFAQPRGEAFEKKILKMEHISGSKSIVQKCEMFISLNKQILVDEGSEVLQIKNDTRMIDMYLGKNRLSSENDTIFNLYNLPTGNFVSLNDYKSFSSYDLFMKG
jgi:hypothetical protein